MARCPDCNKFVGYDEAEPEVNSLEINGTTITGEVRVTLNCAECGTELRESNFEPEIELEFVGLNPEELTKHFDDEGLPREGHEVDVEGDAEFMSRTEGKGRGTKTFYGYNLNYTVTCSCQEEAIHSGSMDDYCQASSFEDLT